MTRIFDTGLAARRKLRALNGEAPAYFLLERVAEDLGERLAPVDRRFEQAVTIGAVTPHAGQALAMSGKVRSVRDIEHDPKAVPAAPTEIVDEEDLRLEAGSIDLAVSLLALHEVNDLPGILVQICRALRPDGLFLAAFAGHGTLGELRESLLAAETEITGGAAPRVYPFAEVRDAGALLQRAGFALPVADVETLTVRYASMFDLMRDLRGMGATNSLLERSRRPLRRDILVRAAEIYATRFADPDGRVRATFSIIWMSGWAPHESQQKPLARGSATVSLAQILKDESGV